jgi:hypothetical protein
MKHMSKGVLKSLVLSLLFAAACNSNPYSDQNARLSAQPPQKTATLPGFTVEAPAVVDVTEGASNVKIPITSHVLSGTPIVTVENLPSFATWDAANSTVLLNPPIGASVDPAQPMDTTRKYSILAKASSTDASMSFVQQTIVILVHHKAESLVVGGFNSQVDVLEGTTYKTTVRVQSLTFPTGPFFPVANNLPDGVTIAPTTDPTTFTISYSPTFSTVTSANSAGTCPDTHSVKHLCKTFNWTLNVTDPKGDAATLSTRWRVLDVRQSPSFVAPPSVDGSTTSVDFYVHAEDTNNEVIPTITFTQPALGKLTLTTVSSSGATANSYPTTLVHVVWTGDFQSLAGRSQVLNFKTCVQSGPLPDSCTSSQVTANIRAAASDLAITGLAATAQVLEGQTYQATVQIKSTAYPTGPFFVTGTNLPDGLKITATSDPTKYTVSYTPSYTALLVGATTSYCPNATGQQALCKATSWKLNAIDPKGAMVSFNSTLTLLDVRQAPLVIMPRSISGTSSGADFYVQVEDPNGEAAPQVTVTQPSVGSVTLTSVASSTGSNGSLPYNMVHVVWSGANGASQILDVVACVNDNNGQSANCVTIPASVNLQ